MSKARNIFIQRLKAYKLATEEELIIAKAPSEILHNSRARLYRNGLAVVGFTALEDFLKSRTSEVLTTIGNGYAKFADLPDRIKDAATIGALKAVNFHANIVKHRGDDVLAFIQHEAGLIASTTQPSFQISGFSLGWNKSNLSDADINEILGAFQIKNGWGEIARIAHKVGLGIPSLQGSFKNAALRRHAAAHVAHTESEVIDLQDFRREALAIALGFDILLSRCLRLILDTNKEYLSGKSDTVTSRGSILFADSIANQKWRVVKEGNKRANRRFQDLDSLMNYCMTHARENFQSVVFRDISSIPYEWHTPFLT